MGQWLGERVKTGGTMYLLNKTMNGIRLYYLILLGILYLSFYQSSVYFLFFTNTILAYIPIELTFLAMYCKKKYIIVKRPPKVRPKNLTFGGRYLYGKISF